MELTTLERKEHHVYPHLYNKNTGVTGHTAPHRTAPSIIDQKRPEPSRNAPLTYLCGLDRLNFPRARHELHRLRRLVGDLDLVHKDVLVLKGVALLGVVLTAHFHPECT